MINKQEVKTILLITLSNLGDIILTTPVLERLYDEFPDAECDIVTGIPGKDIFIQHPMVRKVLIKKRHRTLRVRMSEVRSLRKKRYDLIIDLKHSLLPYIVGAKYHAGLLDLFRTGSSLYEDRKVAGILHKRDEHLLKLKEVGIEPFRDNRFYLPISLDERNSILRVLDDEKKSKIIVLNPGAKSHLKRWSADKYAALGDKLIRETGCRIVVIGNEDDRAVIYEVIELMENDVIDLCCKTSLGGLCELMKNADLVITNDSAPLHAASAVNVSTIAIFGPTDERRYGPLSDKSKVIKTKKRCRPCEKALCKTGPDEGCIVDIEVDEVFEAAREMLGD